jgi:hypothetical protein
MRPAIEPTRHRTSDTIVATACIVVILGVFLTASHFIAWDLAFTEGHRHGYHNGYDEGSKYESDLCKRWGPQ